MWTIEQKVRVKHLPWAVGGQQREGGEDRGWEDVEERGRKRGREELERSEGGGSRVMKAANGWEDFGGQRQERSWELRHARRWSWVHKRPRSLSPVKGP